MRVCLIIAALTASLWSVRAEAQAAAPPEGCAAFLTVQTKACSVSLYWRCETAPSGTTWEASYDADGPMSVHTYDKDFQWLDAFYFETETTERIYSPGPDPISMSELLDKGVDTYDFTTIEQTGDETAKLRTQGRDEATGETKVIDGVELLTVKVQSRTEDEDGNTIFAAEGLQYVMKDERLFMLGKENYFDGDTHWSEDSTPIDFIFPGEKGFEDTTPRYGCNAVDAAYRLPPVN